MVKQTDLEDQINRRLDWLCLHGEEEVERVLKINEQLFGISNSKIKKEYKDKKYKDYQKLKSCKNWPEQIINILNHLCDQRTIIVQTQIQIQKILDEKKLLTEKL